MLGRAVTGVRHLVRLDHQPEGVAADEDEHDADQDEGRLLPALSEVLARGAVVERVVAEEAVLVREDGRLGRRRRRRAGAAVLPGSSGRRRA